MSHAASYELPWGLRLQGLLTLQSGRPYTLYSGTDSPFGTNNNRLMAVPSALTFDPAARLAILIDPALRARSWRVQPALLWTAREISSPLDP